ncbi:MAG: aspartyl-tRNA(Asn)/glutamyl-tRNA(Gln) amidotransferase subunit [Chloroflexota bacterium]|nr:aspartyl-tRNA(Asn)/glutamyl-tRNA(Gln) amidotransferase subunit [Chloroflexota bacterium]
MTQLADLGVAELLDAYRSHKASPLEAVESCLDRIGRLDDRVQAVLTLTPDLALDAAKVSTERWMSGDARPLEGIPYGLKDIIATKGVRTTGGSAVYADWVPEETATLAERLDDAGAAHVAKLYTFEFAGGANATTNNPWDLERTAAGSSSGSAAAVAARELPLAIGTDTGGSIAIPAAFAGITGLKATYGRIPRTGVMPLSWTLDHAGPMTRSAIDAAHALQAMAGYDPKDPNSMKVPVDDYLAPIKGGVDGLRIGVPRDWFFGVCDPEIAEATHEAVRELERAGATVTEFDLPSTKQVQLHAIELTIVYAEMASLHSPTFSRLDEYGPEYQKLLARGQFVHAADYLHCLRARHLVQLDFERAFEEVDVAIVPGCVCIAPRHDRMVAKIGDQELPLLDVISRTTAVFNIVGIPTLTIPSGLDSEGLPMGIAIAARPFDEATMFRAAHAYQQLTDHHRLMPALVKEDSEAEHSPGARPTGMIEKPIITATKDSIW